MSNPVPQPPQEHVYMTSSPALRIADLEAELEQAKKNHRHSRAALRGKLAEVEADRDLWKERARRWEHRSKSNLRIIDRLIGRNK